MQRVGGEIELKLDGTLYKAKGSFTYNIGVRKKEAVAGADGVHGYRDETKVPFIEGAITDDTAINLKTLQETNDATVTLTLANGKVIALREAVYTADGDVTTEEGEVQVRFEGVSAEEIAA